MLWGLGLQITLGVIILRWSRGYQAFKFLGELVRQFLEYTDEGSKFVFGEQGLILHPVVFKVRMGWDSQLNLFFFLFFKKYFHCISSDFSDLPDMTDEYIDLSVYVLTGWLLYILHLTYIQK